MPTRGRGRAKIDFSPHLGRAVEICRHSSGLLILTTMLKMFRKFLCNHLVPLSCYFEKLSVIRIQFIDLNSPSYTRDVKSVRVQTGCNLEEKVDARLSQSSDPGLAACSFPVLHQRLLFLVCQCSAEEAPLTMTVCLIGPIL